MVMLGSLTRCSTSKNKTLLSFSTGFIHMTDELPTEVILLKHGKEVMYRYCDCCLKPARVLSQRRWCTACEWECTAVGIAARRKLAEMADSITTDPSATRAV
jgi:hypothetical protein